MMFRYEKVLKGFLIVAMIFSGLGELLSVFLEKGVGFLFFSFALFCASVIGLVFLLGIFVDVFTPSKIKKRSEDCFVQEKRGLFCTHCGQALSKHSVKCPLCHKENDLLLHKFYFCEECGEPINANDLYCRYCGLVTGEKDYQEKKLSDYLCRGAIAFFFVLLLFVVVMLGVMGKKTDFSPLIILFDILICIAYYKMTKMLIKSVFVAKLLYVLFCLLTVGSISITFIASGVLIFESGLSSLM